MELVMLVPGMPFVVWLVMVALTLAAVWVARHEFRTLATERPMVTRFAGAFLVAVLGAIALRAQPLNTICDWDALMQMCGGWQACAWAAWYANACPWL